MQRKASAVWSGGIKDGKGTLSTESGALKDIKPAADWKRPSPKRPPPPGR